jgi:hypothetical protein
VTTDTFPDENPAGTFAWTSVAVTVPGTAEIVPNLTALAPSRFVPVIVRGSP